MLTNKGLQSKRNHISGELQTIYSENVKNIFAGDVFLLLILLPLK